MEVDQDDQLQCYFVVLACLLRTLQQRPKRRKFLFFKAQDALVWKKLSGERIFLRLVRPLLPSLEKLPTMSGIDGTPAHLVVAYVSNWVAGQIEWWQPFGSENLSLFHDLLRHCIRLDGNCPEHRYRLGAVLCLLNEEQAANETFAEAQKRDSLSEFYSPREVGTYAAVVLGLAYDHDSVSVGHAAAAVAFVMRALELGEHGVADRITKEFIQTKYWHRQMRRAKYGYDPTWTTTDQVLCAALNLALPAASSPPVNEAAN